jgi:hypothetical protein
VPRPSGLRLHTRRSVHPARPAKRRAVNHYENRVWTSSEKRYPAVALQSNTRRGYVLSVSLENGDDELDNAAPLEQVLGRGQGST